MTEEEFRKAAQTRLRNVQCRIQGSGIRTHPGFLIKVIRAILGMANQHDGGKVILGVESDPLDAVGFEEDEAKAWLNYDALASKVNESASPPVSFGLEAFRTKDAEYIESRSRIRRHPDPLPEGLGTTRQGQTIPSARPVT